MKWSFVLVFDFNYGGGGGEGIDLMYRGNDDFQFEYICMKNSE